MFADTQLMKCLYPTKRTFAGAEFVVNKLLWMKIRQKGSTYLKLENHLTSCAVLFLLNLMSGKYILRMAEEGYLVQKNINLAFLKCIGVSVELWASDRE